MKPSKQTTLEGFMKAANKTMKQWLIFIDTNILLDFYRQSGESAIRQISLLEKHKSSLIITDQVWMEFLKNRQQVLASTVTALKQPDGISFPPFLSDYQPAKTVVGSLKNASTNFKKVRRKIDNMISNPSSHDDVYKGLLKIFSHVGEYTLTREGDVKHEIRQLAQKRFMLGYPPRKSSDNSIGDAVNWEWIIHCAIKSADRRNIMIVSRDNDYGMSVGQDRYLNDWLVKEFKERVSTHRQVELSPKLTVALRRMDEQVSRSDEREEAAIIAAVASAPYKLDDLKRKYLIDASDIESGDG
jgi:hypothetical protein